MGNGRREDGVAVGMVGFVHWSGEACPEEALCRKHLKTSVDWQTVINLRVFAVQMPTLFNLMGSCCVSIFQRVIKRLLDALKPIILKFSL